VSYLPTRTPASTRRPGSVAVTIDERSLRGRAVDLREWELPVETVVDAVVAAATHGPGVPSASDVGVDCDPAGPIHAHVCRIPPRSFDPYDALVAAARSRGTVVPEVRRLEGVRAELAAVPLDEPTPDRAAAKRRVADAGRETRRLDERVASLRGRLSALRDVGADTSAVEADLAEAVGALTEAETERIAAEQRLAQVERAARTARDRRQRRLRLADRLHNLRRRVRRALVASVADDFAAAVASLPGDAAPDAPPAAYAGDPTTAALAVARVARLRAPVVLSTDRFGSPGEAATRLDAPVVRV
jgi:hypothetical protein